MTLTLGELAEDDKIGVYWNRLRASLRRHKFRFYRYFWVKECQASGKVHMHIIIDAYVPWRLIKRLWYKATNHTSYVVDIRAAKNVRNVAGYMTKYMAKAVEHPIGHNQRKFGFSRFAGFRVEKFKPDVKMTFLMMPIVDRKHLKRCLGRVSVRNEKRRLMGISKNMQYPLFWKIFTPSINITGSNNLIHG